VSETGRPFAGVPAVVLGLAAAIGLAQIPFTLLPDDGERVVITALGVIPLRYAADSPAPFAGFADAAAPLVGHVFLHGGWLHLFFNLVLLLQVGPLASAGLGPRSWARFLALFWISAVAGALLYIGVNPQSAAPAIGASGAVSGVFAGYLWGALRFAPPTGEAFRRILMSGGVFLFLNVGLAAAARLTGFLPIAWEAHLGGFVAGLAAYPLLVRRGGA
jgi:membrane associated rhomboid family serine protease